MLHSFGVCKGPSEQREQFNLLSIVFTYLRKGNLKDV